MELITLWEQGVKESSLRRGMTLLSAALPEVSREDLESLSIGLRDNALLSLREMNFGPSIQAVTICPKCGEKLEMTLPTVYLRSATDEQKVPQPHLPQVLEQAGYRVEFRVPTCGDLEFALASAAEDLEASRKLLLRRCLLEISREGKQLPPDEIPGEIEDLLINQMAAADPQSLVRLRLDCPACQYTWQADFDIMAFFWEELEAWAIRTLHQVHTLASAYAWNEAEILEISPWRRQCYLELVTNQGMYD